MTDSDYLDLKRHLLESDKKNARLEEKIDLLLSVIVVQQKSACGAADVSDETARNKARRGEIGVLQREGSRLNYVTIHDVGQLKKRTPRKR